MGMVSKAQQPEAPWEQEFQAWLAPFLAALGHKARRRWAPLYLAGLLGPGERKSIEPIAARVAPDDLEQLHHFIATSAWDPTPLERELARAADALVGGEAATLVIDDTALPKKGAHSVGVAHQYCGCLGKQANCQTLVSLTLAQREVPVPLALRLYLPETWCADPDRLDRAHVPESARAFREKWRIALDELDAVCAAGIHFGCVAADAAYGDCGEFRAALTARKLRWAVGVRSNLQVYPQAVRERWPAPNRIGRPRKHPALSHPACSAAEMIAAHGRFRTVRWRVGTQGPLRCEVAAVRVRVADGARMARGRQRRPGELVWLVGERRADGEVSYYLTNHPAATALRTLVRAIKARWVCEQAHQQMKEELGLDHFEGRSYLGLHHHALMTLIAMAFLQHLRLKRSRATKKNRPAQRPTARTEPARRAPRAPRHLAAAAASSLPRVPCGRALSSA